MKNNPCYKSTFLFLVILQLMVFPQLSYQEVTVTPITEPGAFYEGTYWDYVTNRLLFVDYYSKTVHRLNPDTYEQQIIYLDQIPTLVIAVRGFTDRYVISQGKDLVYIFWDIDGGDYFAQCRIATVDINKDGNIFDDGKADAFGRFWGGTIDAFTVDVTFPIKNQASFYRIDTLVRGKPAVDLVFRNITISNGLVWSPDNRKFYYTDSLSYNVYVFNFNLARGTISSGRVLFNFIDFNLPGLPDSMTIDSNGNLWIASFGGGQVVNFNPKTGQFIGSVKIPTVNITNVTFGGRRLDVMYVSTLAVPGTTDPLAGSVFEVTGLGVTGIYANRAVVNSDCTPEYIY